MMKILRQKMSTMFTLAALMCGAFMWGQNFTLTHGFGGASGVPTGIQVVSYDGATACNTSSNGGNAVTTLRIKAMPGYNFTVTSISGTGVRSNSGPTSFTIQYVNSGNTNTGTVATVPGTSSCSGNASLNSLVVPPANQQVQENAFVDIKVQRAPGSTSGLGYSHVKSITINGVVSPSAPSAPVATAATAVVSTGFMANWNAVTNATGYRLDVATDAAFTQMHEIYDNFAVAGTSQFCDIDILANTAYYYRVRAEINTASSDDSNTISLATPNPVPATVVTTQVLNADITAATAIAGGNVTDDGQDTVSARGTVYTTTANPTTASSLTTDGTGEGIFISNLASLSPDTQYYYRAYATNSTGTTYGAEYSFRTHANVPGAPVTSNPSLFALDVALDINGNPAGTLYAIRINGGGNTNMYVDANGNLTDTIVWLTAAQWGALVNVDVLQPNTLYTFDVAAQSGAGVQTSWSTVGTGTTAALAGPTTLTLISNTIDFEPACLSTDPDGAVGSFSFEATNLSGQGIGLGDAMISGPNGQPLEGITFSTSLTGTFDGTLLIEDIEEGEDVTVYVRFDPTAGVSYGAISIEVDLVDAMNNTAAPIEVESVIVDLPEAATAQTVCNGATVADLLTTSGTNIKWYTAETGGAALATTEVLTAQTYYASQSIGECESGRIAVVLTVNPIPDAPVAAPQAFCGPSTVADLVVTTGEALKWYNVETGGTELAETEAIATGNYYVTQIVNGCESPRTTVAITVNPIPAAPVAATQAFCGANTVANLAVTTGESPKWYTEETGGTELAATVAIATGTYYVSQTVNGCESPRTAVEITVNQIPAAPVVTDVQPFCAAATVADLEATGEGILWYTVSTGGTALDETTALTAGTSIYYASQTVNGCESTLRSAVAVQLTVTAALAASAQAFCGEATVSELMSGGTAVQWYADETGGTALAGTDSLETATYYATQTINGCESPRTAVAVTVNAIPDAPTAAAQDFCGSAIVSQLAVTTGTNALWYETETGSAALPGNTALQTGTYHVSQIVNGCESPRTAVEISVNTVPAVPATTPLTFCNVATVDELTATGDNLQWYAAATGGEALEATAGIQSGLYYVSQTVNGCESVRTAVQVTLNVTAAPTAEAQSFCNAATVADLEVVTGTAVKWYADETGGTALDAAAALETATYYVSQTLTTCESPRTAVAVTVTEVANLVGETEQEFEAGETLADLEVEGENIVWYAEETLENILPETTLLIDGTIYYAVATQGECTSDVHAVLVDEVLNAGGFDKGRLRFFPNPVSDVLNLTYGEDITGVVVYNLLGQPVLTATSNAATTLVDMSSLAAGNYIVKIASGDSSATIKVIKR